MYNHEVTLIGYETTKDDIGNTVKIPIKTTVLCRVDSIGQSEFYNANVSGLKPELKIIIKVFEYNGEKDVLYEGTEYKVIRTYHKGEEDPAKRIKQLKFDEIELTCEKVIG